MKFFEKKSISLADEIKRVIRTRILVCFVILFSAFIFTATLNISTSFHQLEKSVQEQCNILSEFTISQVLIDNEKAVQLNLNNINQENRFIHFKWIKNKPLPKNSNLRWEFPLSWSDYCPIRSQDGENFGYFKATGSLLYNQELISSSLIRLVSAIVFVLVIFLLLYPLGNKIPQRLFVRPIMNLLNILKSGSKDEAMSDEKIPVEIEEIKVKLIQMLEEAESHSHEVAFGQIAAKVAHDIRSPLAALNMLLKRNSAMLPEEERNIIKSATQRINDIANNLLTQKRSKNLNTFSSKKVRPELATIFLENIISEKRAQYSERDIQFKLNIAENSYDIFVNVNADELSRALSNLINNSVEAISDKGTITLALSRKNNRLALFTLIDSGLGMHPEQLEQVLKNSVSIGKKDGSGIGLSSAIQSIQSWGGNFSMKSEFEKGTQVEFVLPIEAYPEWFVSTLALPEGSIILILDDDEVIHQVWTKRLNEVVKEKQKKFEIFYFHHAEELFQWYENLHEKKENIILLTDYELIGSNYTGIDVIKKLNIVNNAILVTSRYDDENVRLQCEEFKIKFIPKSFAVHIPIYILEFLPDFIFIDDSIYLTDAWKMQAELDGKKLVVFNSLDEVNRYIHYFSTNTPLYIDSNLGNNIKGEDLAKELHKEGFSTIYLCTGMDDSEFSEMPWIKKIIGKEYPF